MSKRPAQQDDSQRRQPQGKRPRPPAPKKHLYLVLDDWERGYSIRQIDPDTMAAADSDDLLTHLPEPAAFRFVAPASSEDTRFVAMGTNIVVVSTSTSSGVTDTEAPPPPTLVYDTAAAALATAPPLPGLLIPDLLVTVADAVYALTTLGGAGMPLAFESFSWAPRTGDEPEPGRPTHAWSWKTASAPPPPPPHFDPPEAAGVVSYAVHPTVFVSTRGSTYSFDTAARGGRREWRWHGDWALPFRGQGFFDRELGAWVGLDAEKQGRLCACQVPSRGTTTSGDVVPPESDRTEEKLFCATAAGEGARSESDATLAYMGDGRFCVVESLGGAVGLGDDERVVRVTVFGLKFDWNGKLRTTSHRASSAYVVPKYVPSFSPVAFWM